MMTLTLERPPLETLKIEGAPDDISVPEISLVLGEVDELDRLRLVAMTRHMITLAASEIEPERAALLVATESIRGVTAQTTLGEAAVIKERYRIVRSKYLVKRNRLQKRLDDDLAQLLDRITEHGVSDDLSLAICEGHQQQILRQMLLGKLIDYPSFPRKKFALRYGAKKCPHCGGVIGEGRQAVFDGKDRISHPSCYGALLILVGGDDQDRTRPVRP